MAGQDLASLLGDYRAGGAASPAGSANPRLVHSPLTPRPNSSALGLWFRRDERPVACSLEGTASEKVELTDDRGQFGGVTPARHATAQVRLHRNQRGALQLEGRDHPPTS